MDMITMIVGSALGLLLVVFLMRLSYTIMINLVNGRKFHHSLMQEFDNLRLSKMLTAVGINKTGYIYQTNVNEIKQHMKSCESCDNTDACDDKLSKPEIDVNEISFCNNEAQLKEILTANQTDQ